MDVSQDEIFTRELLIMLNARMTIWVETTEEERFLKLFNFVAQNHIKKKKDLKILSWSSNEGLLNMNPSFFRDENGKISASQPVTKDVVQRIDAFAALGMTSGANDIKSIKDILDYCKEHSWDYWYLIKDIHNFLKPNRSDYAELVRRLREMIETLQTHGGNLIFVGPRTELPVELQSDIKLLTLNRPDNQEIKNIFEFSLKKIHKVAPTINFCVDFVDEFKKTIKSNNPYAVEMKVRFLESFRGMTKHEIIQEITYVIIKNKGLDEQCLDYLQKLKIKRISEYECLEFIPISNEVKVGGHEDFKDYIQERGLFLDPKIRNQYNLKAPKGTLAVGVPGGGKSIMAKYIGFLWNIPIIRLDVGSIYQKWLGESESRLREALKFIEYNTPCILWVDEIEKSLGTNDGESGTSNRVLGKLLTWMAERTDLVYMFCTANNISKIPSEFLRSGRFDTIQWFDLPTAKDCEEIIRIHCKANSYECSNVSELALLAEHRNLTGAEIESAIIDANFGRASEKPEPKYGWLFTKLNEVKSVADANEENLMNMRRVALRDYEFTSKIARQKIEQLVNNQNARRAEFNLNN